MNNLLSYCGLVDPRISASDKNLPVNTLGGSGGDSSWKWLFQNQNGFVQNNIKEYIGCSMH
jgi:hypothetical protein